MNDQTKKINSLVIWIDILSHQESFFFFGGIKVIFGNLWLKASFSVWKWKKKIVSQITSLLTSQTKAIKIKISLLVPEIFLIPTNWDRHALSPKIPNSSPKRHPLFIDVVFALPPSTNPDRLSEIARLSSHKSDITLIDRLRVRLHRRDKPFTAGTRPFPKLPPTRVSNPTFYLVTRLEIPDLPTNISVSYPNAPSDTRKREERSTKQLEIAKVEGFEP